MRILSGMTNTASQSSLLASAFKHAGVFAKSYEWQKNPYAKASDVCFNLQFKSLVQKFNAARVMSTQYHKLKDAYDVFYFHSGSSLLPKNLDLKFLSKQSQVIMEFHGSDIREGKKFIDLNPYANILSQYLNNPGLIKKNKRIFESIDLAVVHDTELERYLPDDIKRLYIPLRVDLDYIKQQAQRTSPALSSTNFPIKVVHIPSKRNTKGTKYVLQAFEELKEYQKDGKQVFDCKLLEHLSHEACLREIAKADIYIDQLLIGSYGLAALEAMSLQTLCVCFLLDEVSRAYDSYPPIVSSTIHTLAQDLIHIAKHREAYKERALMGLNYVECYHEYKKVGAYALDQIAHPQNRLSSVLESFRAVKEV